MTKENDTTLKKVMTIITVIVTILLVAFIIYAVKMNLFNDSDLLVDKIKSYGLIGPIIFLLIQIVQVVFPVIPGGASCLVGVLAFGPLEGFIYNYVGLTLGSIVSFFLSRSFGLPLINKLFQKETVDKYLKYIRTKKFEKIFFWGIFLPGAPDDLLCYIAGISGLSFIKFLFIILIGKPFTLIFYSLFTKFFM